MGIFTRKKPAPTAAAVTPVQQRYLDWQSAELTPRSEWPVQAPAVLDPAAVPDIPAAELTAELLADGLRNHGFMILRGFVGAQEAQTLREDLDRVFALAEAQREQDAWFQRLADPATGAPLNPEWRGIVSGFAGSASAADSPQLAQQLIALYHRTGFSDQVEQYLGERPAVSLEKWVLRRVPPDTNTSWHQDGNKLGDVRAVNLWITLSDCGQTASGLDLVPRRYDQIVPTGTGGAFYKWDVGPQVVDEVRGDLEVLSPDFAAGDAVVFDEFLLHRTGVKPGMTEDRYAIETWFFAPSHFPAGYHGLMV